MKKKIIMVIMAILLFGSCVTGHLPIYPPEHATYSETIIIPGESASDIYIKTYLWADQQKLNGMNITVMRRDYWWIHEEQRRMEYFSSLDDLVIIGEYNGDSNFSFSAKNEELSVYMRTRHSSYDPKHPEIFETWNNSCIKFSQNLKAYFTLPPISDEEISKLVAKGNTAFNSNKISEAAQYYYQALRYIPYDVNLLLAYGRCRKDYMQEEEIYLIALKIEPDNEMAAFLLADTRKRRALTVEEMAKHAEENRIAAAKEQAEREEQKRQQEQQQQADYLAKLSANLALLQQYQSGNNSGRQGQTGTSSGQAQAGNSSGSSSGSSNSYNIVRARNDYNNAVTAAKKAYEVVASKDDVSGRYRSSYQDAQRNMTRIREEAARNGHRIDKSDWETKRLP